jgi:hypothetical protein
MLFNADAFNVAPFNADSPAGGNPFDKIKTLYSQTALALRKAVPVGVASQAAVPLAAALRHSAQFNVTQGTARRATLRTGLRGAAALRQSRSLALAQGTALRTSAQAAMRPGVRTGISGGLLIVPAIRLEASVQTAIRAAHRLTGDARLSLAPAGQVAAQTRLYLVPARRLAKQGDLWFRRDHRPLPGTRKDRHPPTPPDWWDGKPSKPRVLPIAEYYTVENTCSVIRVDDGTPIECLNISISGDRESWSRRFSGAVAYADIGKIRTDNGPVDIQITANGVVWRAVIMQYQDNRRFAQDSASFTATSRAIALAKPYAVPHTGLNASAANAQQLALGLLDYTGWTLDWRTVDWLIPAGVFSLVDASPLDGIKQLAEAVGAFVQCDLVNQVLHVRRLYPVAPWALATASPDVVIPVDAAITVNGEWLENTRFNGVWVTGQNAGVCALVRRTGTAGDVLAPMVVEPLLTMADANRERGIAELAASGARQPMGLTLGIYPEIGIIEPGQIIQVDDMAYSWKGICLSSAVAISWQDDGLDIKQTPVIEHWYG